jgi:hypothetical protein
MDATEGLFKHPFPDRIHLKKSPLNLYTMMLDSLGESQSCVPVGAMISERKTIDELDYFLKKWLRYFKFKPDEMVMDQEAASIHAFMRVFNDLSLEEYVQKGFRFLRNEGRFNFVLLRFDVNHFTHTLSKIKIANPGACSQLVSRSLTLMIAETDFDYVCTVVGNLLVILSSSHKNKYVENSESFLNAHIRGDPAVSEINFQVRMDEDWFQNVNDIVRPFLTEKSDRSINNPYFDVTLVEYLRKVCRKLLVWSAVLSNAKNSPKLYASSAGLENYHNIIKNTHLNGNKVTLDEGIDMLQIHTSDCVQKMRGMLLIVILSSDSYNISFRRHRFRSAHKFSSRFK